MMIDDTIKKQIDPALEPAGRWLAARGVPADAVTVCGLLLGVIAALFIAQQAWLAGLAFILLSRLCDGLDGAVARAAGPTDFGGYLDIVLDFAFYGMVPLAFAFAQPQENTLAAGVLLLSFYVNGASFLAFAVMAEKRGIAALKRGSKSFLFSTGLAEAGETLAVFAAMCLFPGWFAPLAYAFAALVAWTALSRIVLARRTFG